MNLSFAGCGFLGIYHVGVAVCFKQYAPHLLLDKISGASAGAIAACCLLCDLPIVEMTADVLKLAKEARKGSLGPFRPSFNVQDILLESFQKLMPEDVHTRVSGKLHISLTRVYDGKNVIVSQFNSRDDLVQALLASSFIPFFCGLLPPRFHGIRYMDGGFSDNLPTLDENTITISPFCGESDICPRDVSSQLFHVNLANTSIELSRQNMYRFARVLFPPNPEILSNMCKQGFDDALRFLTRNNLINCNRCLAVQSTFVVSETIEDPGSEYDPDCLECKMHRQEASVANLPETILMIFQEAIDSANKGIVNWLFKHKSVRLLSLLSLPYTLPVDVVYVTFTKYLFNIPKIQKVVVDMGRYFLENLSFVFPNVNVCYQPIPTTIKYRVNIVDYDYESNIYGVESNDECIYKQHKANVNLTLEYDDAKSWSSCQQSTNCVINMSSLTTPTTEETFENILQVVSL
ncbi:patatin-like phospholipase domain-containing protein 2 isoform X2 [Copidosoma floridanum]|uniref:patatin-like phospholipase domain-containing protein 2 isoform X2 n=1 Tax=Copidosoma floridanum TaxID=29053 RepID=UPI0006C9BBCD|nr:patatin-like phospholipase domain-containing protein 2 isoform X2 [Copidosoma floridanum]